MEEERISPHRCILFAAGAMLAPMIAVIPCCTARIGGTGGYLGVMPGAAPLLITALFLRRAFRRLGVTGLGALYRRAFSPGWSAALGLMSALVMGGMLATALRTGQERLVQAVYPETRGWIFGAVTAALVWRMSKTDAAANLRMGKLFFFLLMGVSVPVVILGAGKLRWENLSPVWLEDLPGIALAALPCAGLFAVPVMACWEEWTPLRQGGPRPAVWCAAFAGGMAAVGLVCTGVFGTALTARLEIPFFSLAKECAQGPRLEALVAAGWVFGDVLFARLMLRGMALALKGAFPKLEESRGWFAPAVLTLAVTAANLIPSGYTVKQVLIPVWLTAAAVLGYAAPCLACAALTRDRQIE